MKQKRKLLTLLVCALGACAGLYIFFGNTLFAPQSQHVTYIPTEKNLFLLSDTSGTVAPEGSAFPFISFDVYNPIARSLFERRLVVDDVLKKALQGEFQSLAALALIARLEEQQGEKPITGVPAQFWEDWMYRLLGEQEGGYTLGLVASVLIQRIPANDKGDHARNTVFGQTMAAALRRAAKAGHPEAMYGLLACAGPLPDPDFRMPDKPGFPLASQAMLNDSFTPEMLYWLGKAAESGSSRANLRMGLAFMEPMDKSQQNIPTGLDFIKKAVSQGNAAAAKKMVPYMDPRFPEAGIPNASCAQTMHYFALAERMHDENGMLWKERPGRIGLDASSYLDTLFTHMNQGLAGFEQCLTEEEYRTILAETKTEHTAIRADLEAKKHERDELYEQAKKRLPELRVAYERAKGQ